MMGASLFIRRHLMIYGLKDIQTVLHTKKFSFVSKHLLFQLFKKIIEHKLRGLSILGVQIGDFAWILKERP